MGKMHNFFLYSIRKPHAMQVKLRSTPNEYFTAAEVKVNFTESFPMDPARSIPE